MAEPSPAKRPRKITRRPPAEPIRITDYNRFIAGLEMVQIRLTAAELHAPSAPEPRPLAPGLHLGEASYRNSEGQFSAQQPLFFTGTYHGEQEPAIRIHVTFEVLYTSAERMMDEIFAEFRVRNLPVNTWPYFREFVQSSLGRMGWPVLTLPTLKTTPADGSLLPDSDQ